jgi:GNAT superfamily N-acetyltransferase
MLNGNRWRRPIKYRHIRFDRPRSETLQWWQRASMRRTGTILSASANPPGPMMENYAKVIRERRVTVAESRGEITAVLVRTVTEEGFLLENVAVDPSHHGKGLGTTLIELAETEARREGFEFIYLYTHEKMTENQALYAKIGYVEFERRTEKGLARVYMRKSLQ